MSLNRRGLFGTALGGIFAGPDIAKEVVNQISTPSMGQAVTAYDTHPDKLAYSLKEQAERLAKIKRLASGEYTDEDDQRTAQLSRMKQCPYEELKSMSPRAQEFCEDRHHYKKRRERAINEAINILKEYDKTGFLKYFTF